MSVGRNGGNPVGEARFDSAPGPMGSTTTLRESANCPNCDERGEQTAVDSHEDALYDCHNLSCSVDRFWALKDHDD